MRKLLIGFVWLIPAYLCCDAPPPSEEAMYYEALQSVSDTIAYDEEEPKELEFQPLLLKQDKVTAHSESAPPKNEKTK